MKPRNWSCSWVESVHCADLDFIVNKIQMQTISEVTTDWHKLMLLKRVRNVAILCSHQQTYLNSPH